MRLIRITKWDRLTLWSLVFDPSGNSNPYQYLELISNSRLLNQDFIWFSNKFFEVECDQSYYTRSIFVFYFDSLWMDRSKSTLQRIGGMVLRAETKTAASPIETAILPTVLQFTVTFWSMAWKWINFYDLQFSACYSFGKVGKYFQILFRDGIYHWPEFIWYWLEQFCDRNHISSWNARLYYILLLPHSLFIMIFWKQISRLFLPDRFLCISDL